MALFKIFKGLDADLSKNKPNTNEGYCYFTTDTGKMYIDIQNGANTAANTQYRVCLNAAKADVATKLGTSNIGSTTKPIYLSGGTPYACGSSLATNITGNAASATKLQTARTISLTGAVTASGSFNGTSNLALSTTIPNNSIMPIKLAVNDYGNLCNLNRHTAANYSFNVDTTQATGPIYTPKNMVRDIFIGEEIPVMGGEKIEISFEISTNLKGNTTDGGTDSVFKGTAIGIYGYQLAGRNTSAGIAYSDRVTATAEAPWTKINSIVTVPANARFIYVFLQTEGWGNWSGLVKLRNICVRFVTTATKLATSNVGSTGIPVYFSNGIPVSCGNTLNVNITGNAATATKATQDSNGATISSTYLKLAGGTMTGTIVTPGNDSVVIKPARNNYDQIGASDYKFYKIYATTFYGTLSGNATTATKLATARNIQVNLASTSTASFNGSADITPGVTGILGIGNGGTGRTSLVTPTVTWTAGTSAGPTLKIKDSLNNTSSAVAIPSASSSASGIITTSDQSIAGFKTFASGIQVAGTFQTKGEFEIYGSAPHIDFHFNNSTTDYTSRIIETSAGVLSSTAKFYGAVWNDYAEFRTQKETIEPGYCVASTNNGQVYKTTEKFQACDGIVSDTFGFAIGETDECKTPLAVAGRVLAYFHGNREDYHAGDTVCAGPEGKVVKMTREEIKEYPDRIIGIVSEIPEYKIWGSGNVEVNGRIWIKVR